MSASLDMTGATQRAVAAWLTAQLPTWAALTPTWVPRILTGYQRETAGDALSQREAGGEPDTIIVECQNAPRVYNTQPVHDCDVSIRVRHDCDRCSLVNHNLRVEALLNVLFDTEATTNLSAADDYFTAFTITATGQSQTSTGRSFETTIDLRVRCCAADVS
jgi:hypothetical protein